MELQQLFNQVSDENIVYVTHIVNPNKFYIRFVRKKDNDLMDAITKELSELHNIPNEVGFVLKEKEMVAFYHPKMEKYLRVIVDKIEEQRNQKVFILWAVDYGVPWYATNMEPFKQLPDRIKSFNTSVSEACLPVLPYKIGNTVKWSKAAQAIFGFLKSDPKLILKLEGTRTINRIIISDILVKNLIGDVFSVKKELLERMYAMEPQSNFIAELSMTGTPTLERWLNW